MHLCGFVFQPWEGHALSGRGLFCAHACSEHSPHKTFLLGHCRVQPYAGAQVIHCTRTCVGQTGFFVKEVEMAQAFPGKWKLGTIPLMEAGGQDYVEEGLKTLVSTFRRIPGLSSACHAVSKSSDGHCTSQRL